MSVRRRLPLLLPVLLPLVMAAGGKPSHPAPAHPPAPAPGPAVGGKEIDQEAEYRACLKLVATRPRDAFEKAGQLEGLGGGDAARHCRAEALLAIGETEAAATLLEELAQDGRGTAALKVDLLRQAAQAWSLADQPERAMGVVNAALRITPTHAGAREDRAVLRAEQGQFWEAVDDLNAALDAEPKRISALVLRAAAYRHLDTLDLAVADIERALKADPKSADALVERGQIRAARGDRAGARADYMAVLSWAPGDSAIAAAARACLERLDVKAQ